MIRAATLAAGLLIAAPAAAVTCGGLTFRGADYTICEVDPAREEIRLFLNDSEGRP